MTFLDLLDRTGPFALLLGSLCVMLTFVDPYASSSGRHRAGR